MITDEVGREGRGAGGFKGRARGGGRRRVVYGGWPTVSETGGLWFYPFGKVIPALNLFLGKGFLPSWQEGFMGVQDNTGGGKKG